MFKSGFGGKSYNYWLGNELLHQLTKDGLYKLRLDIQMLATGQWYWAEYSTFIVDSEATKYTLTVSDYSGNAGDAMAQHNNMKFSTFDSDNDISAAKNCALLRRGGFWWEACGPVHINTSSAGGGTKPFRWQYLPPSKRDLQTSRGWLMCH